MSLKREGRLISPSEDISISEFCERIANLCSVCLTAAKQTIEELQLRKAGSLSTLKNLHIFEVDLEKQLHILIHDDFEIIEPVHSDTVEIERVRKIDKRWAVSYLATCDKNKRQIPPKVKEFVLRLFVRFSNGFIRRNAQEALQALESIFCVGNDLISSLPNKHLEIPINTLGLLHTSSSLSFMHISSQKRSKMKSMTLPRGNIADYTVLKKKKGIMDGGYEDDVSDQSVMPFTSFLSMETGLRGPLLNFEKTKHLVLVKIVRMLFGFDYRISTLETVIARAELVLAMLLRKVGSNIKKLDTISEYPMLRCDL
ncbi:hypothetical protein ADUPG1_010130 [Aduncisulcus paluster]|uniref:Uncharacterized protein n=1 Tax=Aduncisulcus paluster TaxID=2918883 RepID=A0ABQ5KXY8_9EUKA|nr:hypothetical protein ADUPG1_010130 [Aduncisulcus paluster]